MNEKQGAIKELLKGWHTGFGMSKFVDDDIIYQIGQY